MRWRTFFRGNCAQRMFLRGACAACRTSDFDCLTHLSPQAKHMCGLNFAEGEKNSLKGFSGVYCMYFNFSCGGPYFGSALRGAALSPPARCAQSSLRPNYNPARTVVVQSLEVTMCPDVREYKSRGESRVGLFLYYCCRSFTGRLGAYW